MEYLGVVDIKGDTTKYILVLLELLEYAYDDCKDGAFIQVLMQETSRFFSEFLPIYLNFIYKDDTHRIVYLYTQIAIERFGSSTNFLNHLLVLFHEII